MVATTATAAPDAAATVALTTTATSGLVVEMPRSLGAGGAVLRGFWVPSAEFRRLVRDADLLQPVSRELDARREEARSSSVAAVRYRRAAAASAIEADAWRSMNESTTRELVAQRAATSSVTAALDDAEAATFLTALLVGAAALAAGFLLGAVVE